jgi:hypothetical protein
MNDCQCGCGRALGKDPRAKYATGACRVRAFRQRSVTSVTEEGGAPSVTSVTSDVAQGFTRDRFCTHKYVPDKYEDGTWRGELPPGLTYPEAIANLKRQVQELIHEMTEAQRKHYEERWQLEANQGALDAFLRSHPEAFKDVKRAFWKRYHPDHNPDANPRDIQDLNAALDALERSPR